MENLDIGTGRIRRLIQLVEDVCHEHHTTIDSIFGWINVLKLTPYTYTTSPSFFERLHGEIAKTIKYDRFELKQVRFYAQFANDTQISGYIVPLYSNEFEPITIAEIHVVEVVGNKQGLIKTITPIDNIKIDTMPMDD